MNYTLMPSLEHIVQVKIAATMWNHDHILGFIMGNFYFPLHGGERREEWQKIEDKVIEKVSQLPQPEPLKRKILEFVKPIGLQIFKWMEYHHHYFGIHLPNNLCWTSQGTVDMKKTAEVLIKDENLDIAKRYVLACVYCLENDIPKLWNRMPENGRESFYSEEDPIKVRQQELVVLWTYDMKGEISKIGNMIERTYEENKCSPYHYAFRHAAIRGNKEATQYFLQKLTPKEREESLVRSTEYTAYKCCDCICNTIDISKEYYAEVLCFLLSQMNEEQQIQVFKYYSDRVIKRFLEWPRQSFFIETANRMLNFLSKYIYYNVLKAMAEKVIEGYKDYDYQKLFREFWQKIPNAHKRHVIDNCASRSLLSKLLDVEDKENISLILKDATLSEKEKIIYYQGKSNICVGLAYRGKWDLLKFFIGECITSPEAMRKFKEEFKKRTVCCYSKERLEKEKDMWNKFLQLLDDLIYKDNKKRNLEEGFNSPAKRLHSIEFEKVINC